MTTIAFCEKDQRAIKVLRQHWPLVHLHDDVLSMKFETGGAEVISAGFPCQDVSNANASWGNCAGLAGSRSGLYGEAIRAIRVVRPQFAVLENVAALLGRGMETILGDLAEIGYDAEWDCIRAMDAGLPHERDRVWIVAYPCGSRRSRLVTGADTGTLGQGGVRGPADMRAFADAPFKRGNCWPQPLLRRMDDGLSGRMDRLHLLGNSIIPAIAEMIGRCIVRAIRETSTLKLETTA